MVKKLENEQTYSKENLKLLDVFKNKTDLAEAYLDDEKNYTIQEALQIIKEREA